MTKKAKKAAKRSPKRSTKAAQTKPEGVVMTQPVWETNRTEAKVRRSIQMANIKRAVLAQWNHRTRGRQSTAVKIGQEAMLEVCTAIIVDRVTNDQAFERLGSRANGVAKRNIARFVEDVYARYRTLCDEQAMAEEAMEPVRQAGDLTTKVHIVTGTLLAKLNARIDAIDPGELNDKSMHPMLRALEVANDAAKIEADAEKKRAEIRRILAKYTAETGGKGDAPKALMSVEQAMAEMLGVLGVPVPAGIGGGA